MSKSYKISKTVVHMGPKKGKTLYSVRPYSYGTLTTEEVAKQISMESTATPADVKAVLDRYAYYVKENLKKGYDIELLGFGKLYLRFITSGAVEDEKNANAKLVKSLIPSFRPAYSLLKNGSRVYNLVPDNIELVNYDDEKKSKTPGDSDGGGSAGENKNPGSDDNTQGAGGSGNTGGTGDTDQGGNTDQGGESSGGNEHITL